MRCVACGDEMSGRARPHTNGGVGAWRGVPDFEYGTYHPVDFVRCVQCGTIQQSPLPDAAAIPVFYPSDYRNHLAASGKGLFALLKRLQTRRLARRIKRYIPDRGAKVLEIGCGSGSLLVALKDMGFPNVAGTDFDNAGAAVLAGRGVRFRRVDIEQGFPFDEQFDAVVVVNVIEHFIDPAGVLRRVGDHLAPSGKMIVVTPNAEAPELSIFGRFWSGFHAPRHVHLFTRRGLELMARAAGYEATAIWPVTDPGQWAISLQNALQSRRFSRVRLSHGLAWYAVLFSVFFAPVAWLQNLWPQRSGAMLAVFRMKA